MPLLIFVSGYLFAFSVKKYSLKTLCHKKMVSLLVPLFVNVSILMLLYESDYTSLEGLKYTCMHIVYSLPKKLWFLWAVLYCMIFVCTINKLHLKSSLEFALTMLGVIVLYLIPDTILPNADLYKYMLPYFVIGYYFKLERDSLNISFNKVILLAGIFLTVYAICIHYFHTYDYVYISGSYIFRTQDVFANILICLKRIIIGLVGIATALTCSFVIVTCMGKISSYFAYCGQKSLGIYIFSTLCFDGLALNLYSSYSMIYIMLTFVIVLAISLLLTVLVEKNNLSRLLLLGGR